DNGETGEILPHVTRFLDIHQPIPGTYTIEVHGLTLGSFAIDVKAFAMDSSPQPFMTLSGIANVGSTSTFQVQLTTAPGTVPKLTKQATFPSTLDDINNSLKLGLIDNVGIINSLSQKIQNAEDAVGRGQINTARNILGAYKNDVNAQAGKHVMGIAVQV